MQIFILITQRLCHTTTIPSEIEERIYLTMQNRFAWIFYLPYLCPWCLLSSWRVIVYSWNISCLAGSSVRKRRYVPMKTVCYRCSEQTRHSVINYMAIKCWWNRICSTLMSSWQYFDSNNVFASVIITTVCCYHIVNEWWHREIMMRCQLCHLPGYAWLYSLLKWYL